MYSLHATATSLLPMRVRASFSVRARVRGYSRVRVGVKDRFGLTMNPEP